MACLPIPGLPLDTQEERSGMIDKITDSTCPTGEKG